MGGGHGETGAERETGNDDRLEEPWQEKDREESQKTAWHD